MHFYATLRFNFVLFVSQENINNQMVYNSPQIRFGTGTLIGYIPWHSSSQIHIVATSEDTKDKSTPKRKVRDITCLTPCIPGWHLAARSPRGQASLIKRIVGALEPQKAFAEADTDMSHDVSREELLEVRHAVTRGVPVQVLHDVT